MSWINKFFNLRLSIKLLLVVLGSLFFGDYLPPILQSVFFTISVTIKSILLFILPVIIFSCLFSCLLSQRDKAFSFMIGLFLFICISNCLSTLVAYTVGSIGLTNIDFTAKTDIFHGIELAPLWTFQLPKWMSNDQALYLALILGILFSIFPNNKVYTFSLKAKEFLILFLERAFIPVLPLFALGFILKMQYDGILGKIIQSYLPIIILISLVNILYLSFLFAIASNFNLNRWIAYLKNVLPAGMTAFSTMSSMATLPITLNAAEKNTGNPDIVRAVVPATVTTHLVGDSIGIPLMAFMMLLNYGMGFPEFSVYIIFSFFFVLAKFAGTGIPGGGIIVMIPVLEAHLGFTGEMSALITTLYILFDPVITATNVLGNSAFAILVTKWFSKVTPVEVKALV